MALLQEALGRGFDPQDDGIRFDRPRSVLVPEEVFIPDLQMGGGAADPHLQRAGDNIAVNVTRREGDGQFVIRV